ncbi:MAG: FAD:protein transferase [Patescibacteria group bacterium]|nr:FAD:protein transferase [Patescibacteria group bacterium]
MGMPITVEAFGANALDEAIDEVFAYFHHVDAVFSTYKPNSEISRFNRGELKRSQVREEVREVLDECESLKKLTDGCFDMVWDGHTDPSGYVKGWAVYQAARLLDRRYITRYCINAGGDMQMSGDGPDGGPWAIGVANPFEPGKLAKLLYLKNAAVATSGTAERGEHIYNPRTGRMVGDPVSLTVVGATIDRVDALATAAFCMGRPGLAFLHSQGCEAMMVHKSGQVVLTEGFRRFERP